MKIKWKCIYRENRIKAVSIYSLIKIETISVSKDQVAFGKICNKVVSLRFFPRNIFVVSKCFQKEYVERIGL